MTSRAWITATVLPLGTVQPSILQRVENSELVSGTRVIKYKGTHYASVRASALATDILNLMKILTLTCSRGKVQQATVRGPCTENPEMFDFRALFFKVQGF